MRTLVLLTFLGLGQMALAQQEPVPVAGGNLIAIQTSAICEMCKEAIEYELTFTKGIKEADLNLEDKVVTVKYNPKKVSAEEIRKQIAGVGYHADNVKRDSVAYENLPACCKDGAHGTGEHH